MKHYSRILFVDADDTARAPMAKAILQSKELPWPMEIGSRGLVVLQNRLRHRCARGIVRVHK